MPGVLVWALAFPLILSTVFMMMFGPLDDQAEIDPIPLVVVNPADDVDGQSFQAFLDALSDDEDGEPLFAITYAPNAEEALALVEENMAGESPYVGYVQLSEGTPDVHVTSVSDLTGMEQLKTSVLIMAMDNYVANAAMIHDLMNSNPSLLAQPDVAETLGIHDRAHRGDGPDDGHGKPAEGIRAFLLRAARHGRAFRRHPRNDRVSAS